jgi:hypothetical protein
MSTRTIVHRSVATFISAGAAAALALAPAGGAHAAVQAQFITGGSASSSVVGGGANTCDLTGGSSSATMSQVAFNHGTKRRSADLKATYTDSLNTSDKVTVKGHFDASLTLRKKHNDLSSFDLTGGGSVKVTHTVTGSGCSAEGLVGAGVQELLFTEHKKGWFYVTRDTKKPNSLTEFVLVNLKTDQTVGLDIYEGGPSHTTSRALLKPGKYALEQTEVAITVGGAGLLKSAPLSARAKQTIELKGQFKPLKK